MLKHVKDSRYGNIITTDDINISGDLSNIGNDLSSILLKQAQDIEQLKGNVKFLAKYGGVGGSGTSGGGSSLLTFTKYNITISYTDRDGNLLVVSSINLKTTSIEPILILKGSKLTINCTITSSMSLATLYLLQIQKSSDEPNILTIPTTGVITQAFTINDDSDVFTVRVRGDNGWGSSLVFNVYSELLKDQTLLKSDETYFLNKAYISDDYIDNLKIKLDFDILVKSVFKIQIDKIQFNSSYLNNVIPDYPTGEYTEILEELPIALYIKTGDTINYGLYNLIIDYHITDGSRIITPDPINYMYICKKATLEYVYCYSNDSTVSVYNNKLVAQPTVISSRNIPINFLIYNINGSVNLATKISINSVELSSYFKYEAEYSYTLNNTSESETGEWKEIVFKTDSNSISKYYIYVKAPAKITYVPLDPETKVKYYGAYGEHSDTQESKRNDFVLFPTSKDAEGKYWQFNSNTGNKLIVKDSCIPSKILNVTNGELSSVSLLVKCGFISGNSKAFDCIVNIGIQYLDTSYKETIFTLTDSQSRSIIVRRNEIENCQSGNIIKKWSMPDDGKFHLITFYFKRFYNTDSDLTWDNGANAFSIFIDGVMDVGPLNTLFIVGVSGDTRLPVTVTFNKGLSKYNFFGAEVFNPISNDDGNHYSAVCRKYIGDFDTFIVSNYAMNYANEHYKDNKLTVRPYEDTLTWDASIYDNFGLNYANFYEPIKNKRYGKFIPIDVSAFIRLLPTDNTVPMYRIVPAFIDTATSTKDGLNNLLANTMESYSETDSRAKTKYSCVIQKMVDGLWKDLMTDFTDSVGRVHTVKFYVRFQGSSTLLYSIKNFEIGTVEYTDLETSTTFTYYFNPEPGVFDYPETTFNLKADLVDSSSATNNVIGNFVNDYMQSPFGASYKSCLSGTHIYLFIENNIGEGSESNDLFMGIYNLNLNRGSVNNLGYLRFPDDLAKYYSSNFEDIYCQVTNNTTIGIQIPEGMAVAEILGNSNIYDFSLFDLGLLKEMFDDYYVAITLGALSHISTDYSSKILGICRDFAYYVKTNIINLKGNRPQSFPKNDYGLSNISNRYSSIKDYNPLYYSGLSLVSVPQNAKIIKQTDVDLLAKLSYRTLDNSVSNVVLVGNVNYLFHIVYVTDDTGTKKLTTLEGAYFYVEELQDNQTSFNEDTNQNKFDLENTLKYYMTTQAFAMVDSVLKNLNIKTPDNSLIWHPLFYDMDTGLDLDNAGNNSNYKAFSDFITDDGKIISDYVEEGTTGWFDTPSSYLFLFAKYDALLNHTSEEDSLHYYSPFYSWLDLRGLGTLLSSPVHGVLETVDNFCKDYLYAYLENKKIPPIIWNLNYLYKYFSATNNTSEDTEAGRFNGKMIYRRRTWLNQRINYLDAMFGIANTRTIGYTPTTISDTSSDFSGNKNVKLAQTMFPSYEKGTIGSVNVKVVDEPRTPLVFKEATGKFNLYITDDNGEANIKENIATNVDVGFFGTYDLLSITNCSQLLGTTRKSGTSSDIQGSLIKELYFTSNAPGCYINLSKLPSLEKIIIGNLASTIQFNGDIIICNDDGSGPSQASRDITIIINNVGCNTISISSNIILNSDSSFTNIYPRVNQTSLSFSLSNVILKSDLSISGNISDLTLASVTTDYKIYLESGIQCNKLTCSNLQMNASSTSSSKGLIVNITQLIELQIISSRINYFEHRNSNKLGADNKELNCVSVDLIQTISGALFILNSQYASSQAPRDVSDNSFGNIYALRFVINSASDLPLILRIPGFKSLKDLILDGYYSLGRSGIYGSLIPTIAFKNARSASSGTPTFCTTTSNIDSALVYTKCHIATSYTELKQVFNNVTSAKYLFRRYLNEITIDTICDVFKVFKDLGKIKAITGIFAQCTIPFTGTLALRIEMIDKIAATLPRTSDRHNEVFSYTNVNMLTKTLAATLGGKFKGFLGRDSSGYILVESESFKNFTEVHIPDYTYSTFYNPVIKFCLFYDDDENILSKEQYVLEISYKTEFDKVENLYINIYTDKDISFDFGATGMGKNIKTYDGICKYTQNYGNILNIENMFKNTTNLTTVTYDFYNFLYTPEDDNDDRIVDLYKFLIQNGQLNEKAFKVISSRGSTDNNDSWPFSGSFRKKCTYAEFLEIFNKVSLSKTDIAQLFYNCLVTDVPETISSISLSVFLDKLCKFKGLYNTFNNCTFYNVNNNQVPIDLNMAFSYNTTKKVITTIEDPETGEEKEIRTDVPIVKKSTNTKNLHRAFSNCYLELFTEEGLGITNNSVVDAFMAFSNVIYKQKETSKVRQFSNSNIQLLLIPLMEERTPLLPKNFLSFCTNSSSALQSTFYNSSFDSMHLSGYIPDTPNYFGEGIVLNNTFRNCNIFPHDYYSNENEAKAALNKEIVAPYGTDHLKQIFFPKWYAIGAMSNYTSSGDVCSPFNVYIPIPESYDLNDPEIETSLFGYMSDISGRSYSYGKLPMLPPASNTGIYYLSALLSSDLVQSYNPLCKIYLTLDNNRELPLAGSYYKYMIPYQLSPLLSVGSINNTIITNIKLKSNTIYLPLNVNADVLSWSNIFRGVFGGSKSGNLGDVISL